MHSLHTFQPVPALGSLSWTPLGLWRPHHSVRVGKSAPARGSI